MTLIVFIALIGQYTEIDTHWIAIANDQSQSTELNVATNGEHVYYKWKIWSKADS